MLLPRTTLVVVFVFGLISEALTERRQLCLAGAERPLPFSRAEDLDVLRDCNIFLGDITIIFAEFNANFTPLTNLTELIGEFNMIACDGLESLGHLFPNLAVVRLPTEDLKASFYLSMNANFKQLNLSKLTYLEGSLDISVEHLCYGSTIQWNKVASSQKLANMIGYRLGLLIKPDLCWDICPDQEECPMWHDGQQYCWSSTSCQNECQAPPTAQSSRGFCQQDNYKVFCDPVCLGGCTGPTAADCISCRGRMIIDTGLCATNDECPIGTLDLRSRFCVSSEFCRSKGFKIHGKNCLAECPTDTNDDPNDKSLCVACREDVCQRIDKGDRVVLYAGDFPPEHYTDVVGNVVLNLEGMPASQITKQIVKFNHLRNLTGFLKIYRSERIQDLSAFGALQEVGSDGCELANGYCLVIHNNEFLQRLWTPKTGELRIVKGNVSISHNPRLCQNEIDRFVKTLKLVAPYARVFQEGNGDRGYCGATSMEPFLILDQFIERDARTNDANRSIWQIIPLVAFNLSNYDQLLLLYVYHQAISSPDVDLTYYDAAYCDSSNVWLRHVVQIANYASPEHWKEIDGNKLFMTNVSTPQRLPPNQWHAIYAMAQYLDGTTAFSKIVTFKTIPATPTWGVKDQPSAPFKTYNSITLEWPVPNHPNGNVTHYIIRYGVYENVPVINTQNKCAPPVKINPPTTPSPYMQFDQNLDGNEFFEGPPDTRQERMRNIHDWLALTATKNPNPLQYSEEELRQVQQNQRDPLFRHKRAAVTPSFISGIDDNNEVEIQTTVVVSKNELFCQELKGTLARYDLLSRVLDSKKSDWPVEIVCDNKVRISGLTHFTNYEFQIKACHSPNMSAPFNQQYMCSTALKGSTIAMRTQPHPLADNITLEMIEAASDVVTQDHRVHRKITVQRPNLTNGAVQAFEARWRVVGQQDWLPRCLEYEDDGRAAVFLVPIYDEKYEFQVRVITGVPTSYSESYFFVGVVTDVPLVMILSIGLSVSLLLISAALMTWYALVLRRKKRLMKARGAGTPDWISMNPEYPMLSALDIPAHLELERDDIEVLAEIGHGTFGVVYKGMLKQSNDSKKSRCHVAIKSLRCDASHRQKHDFVHEALLMASMDCHHVVRMVGVVSKTQPIYVVMELMENGDLKSFLVKQRSENIGSSGPQLLMPNSSNSAKIGLPGSLTVLDFTQMAGEIADGMAYLSHRKIVHRDLAARNCLVARDRTVKIGDFGLARDIYDDGYYHLNGRGLLPIRWMAPESLKDGDFDTNSDVWAYGVLLWEIVTYGEQPYQGKSNEEVLEAVKQHRQVLNKPKNCPDKFYNLMLRCWQYKPNERPSFIDIVRELLPALRPDFLKISFYGTLSPSEQLGSSSMALHSPKIANSKEPEDQQSEESNSLLGDNDQSGLKGLTPKYGVKSQAIANLYNIIGDRNGTAGKADGSNKTVNNRHKNENNSNT